MLLKTLNASRTVNKHFDILSTLVDVPTALARSLIASHGQSDALYPELDVARRQANRDCYSTIACEEIFL
jgi:hypothetical protein